MSNNFNLKNYIELLNKQDLAEIDQLQLLSYGALIERQISCNRKKEYFSLIKDYLAKKISPSTFRGKFLKMQKQDDDTAQIMKEDLELEEGLFSLLIDLVYDNSMLTVKFEPEDGIYRSEFKVSIENVFLEFKIILHID